MRIIQIIVIFSGIQMELQGDIQMDEEDSGIKTTQFLGRVSGMIKMV